MRNWYLWLGHAVLWALHKWVGAMLAALLATLGLWDVLNEYFGVPDFRSGFGAEWDRAARLTAIGRAIIVGAWWLRTHVWSYVKLSERLGKAIENLSSENIHLRIYVIDDIVEISRISPRLHARAMGALADFVRSRSPILEESGREVGVKKTKYGPPGVDTKQDLGPDIHTFSLHQSRIPRKALPADVAKALDALSSRRSFFDDPRRWFDLSQSDLCCANMEQGNFRRFSFAGSNLRYARIDKADVREACFAGSVLSDASLAEADARHSDFSAARLHRTCFDGAKLRKANFFGADLYDASMQKADAQMVNFTQAGMWRLQAGLTNFKNADFTSANLDGADLRSAINLTKEQIEGAPPISFGAAGISKNTRLPWSTKQELRLSGIVMPDEGPT